MKLHFLKSKEKRNLIEELEKIYGITELPYLLLETGKQKIRGFSGHLSKEEIVQLTRLTNVEIIGAYLINKKDEEARISFDAIQLFKEKITKNIIEINNQQLQLWLRGYDLEIRAPRGIIILKHQEDFVGIGKSNTEKIFNYVPKERKLKTKIS
ncbi:hypothetical protein J4402_00615 [Candidatus Pacearchaeota archaeon]|nr:hypothetical protein [Candidatus Pacearchaeota archaeon]